MKIIRWTLITLTLVFCIGCQNKSLEITRVAHAGGGFQNKRYTNTLEALNASYKNGFRLFELDLSWTNDGHLVCLHDWKQTAKRLFKHESGEPLSLTEFKKQTTENYQWAPCDIASIDNWLTKHTDAYIITDIKGKTEAGHQLIADSIPQRVSQIIPQFTQKKHYQPIKKLGYSRMIWTLFSYNGTPKTLAEDRKEMELFAITMPKSKADAGWAREIKDTPTYVHTINDPNLAKHYAQDLELTSVYTDFLPVKPEYD